MTLDPDMVAADDKTREWLTSLAALAGHYWESLALAKVPDSVAAQMLLDWHTAYIGDGITWADDVNEG